MSKIFYTLAEDNVDLDFRNIFLRSLSDTDDAVRAVAVEGLWEDERLSTMRQLLTMVNDPSSSVRTAVVISLSRFAYRAELGELAPDNIQALCVTLLDVATDKNQPLDVQRRAVEALGYFAETPAAQAEVARAYDHPELRMKESALVAMGRSMRDQWFGTIEKELGNHAPVLRYAAAQAVGELAEDGEPLLPHLLPLVDDDDAEVAQAAIMALGQVGGTDALRVLQRLIRSRDESRRQAARDALAELMVDEEP
jgi:HEAT repeat protein